MKKKYIFIVEFEAGASKKNDSRSTVNVVKRLYQEFIKDEEGMLTFFRNLVYSYMLDGGHIFSYNSDIRKNFVKEIDLIKPVLDKLSKRSKKKILEIFENEVEGNVFLENFYEMLGKLKISKMNFISPKTKNK